ncbi:WD40-like Beta Propeller Repeat protein [compost metagenome]
MYFYSTKPYDNKTNDYDIWITTQIEGGWGPPVNLEAINSSSWEFSPSISARGTLVFNSERPGGKGQADIYQSEYKDGKLGIPTPIEPLNSKLADAFPYIAEDESFILFSRYNRFLYISYNNNGNWTAPQAIVIKFPDQDNKEDFQLISPMILPDQHTKLLFIKYFPAANQKVAYTIDLADIGIQWTGER